MYGSHGRDRVPIHSKIPRGYRAGWVSHQCSGAWVRMSGTDSCSTVLTAQNSWKPFCRGTARTKKKTFSQQQQQGIVVDTLSECSWQGRRREKHRDLEGQEFGRHAGRATALLEPQLRQRYGSTPHSLTIAARHAWCPMAGNQSSNVVRTASWVGRSTGIFAISCVFMVEVTILDYTMKVLAKDKFDLMYAGDSQEATRAFAAFMGRFGQVRLGLNKARHRVEGGTCLQQSDGSAISRRI